MIFDIDGITMGLVRNTATAILGSNTDQEDFKLGWHLYLSYGIRDRGEEICGSDESDDDGVKGNGEDCSSQSESEGRRKKWWQWWRR